MHVVAARPPEATRSRPLRRTPARARVPVDGGRRAGPSSPVEVGRPAPRGAESRAPGAGSRESGSATRGPATPSSGTTSAFWWLICWRHGRAAASPGTRAGRRLEGQAGGRSRRARGSRGVHGHPGGPVAGPLRFYGVSERLVVVHDELDLGLRRREAQAGRRRGRPQRAGSITPRRWARRTTCGCGSASAGRRVGRTRPTTCSRVLRRRSAGLEFDVDRAADAVEALVTRRDGARANRFHALSG